MWKQLKKSRQLSFLVISLVYVLAAVIGTAVFLALPAEGFLLRLFLADLAATVWVWLMSLLAHNSSVYDPYWSVAPLVMLPMAAWHLEAWHPGLWLVMLVLLVWGIRLTANWALSFKNLESQDWRYTQLHESRPQLWFLINFFGIHLFPTLVVFLAMLPAIILIRDFQRLNAGMLAGAALSLLAAVLQAVSDTQMRRFRREPANSGRVNRQGLWKWSRHPNYLGEILMWWGIYVMMISAVPAPWSLIIGPLANTLMFILISIPLMEHRQLAAKPDYRQYKAETGMLVPRLWRMF